MNLHSQELGQLVKLEVLDSYSLVHLAALLDIYNAQNIGNGGGDWHTL